MVQESDLSALKSRFKLLSIGHNRCIIDRQGNALRNTYGDEYGLYSAFA